MTEFQPRLRNCYYVSREVTYLLLVYFIHLYIFLTMWGGIRGNLTQETVDIKVTDTKSIDGILPLWPWIFMHVSWSRQFQSYNEIQVQNQANNKKTAKISQTGKSTKLGPPAGDNQISKDKEWNQA